MVRFRASASGMVIVAFKTLLISRSRIPIPPSFPTGLTRGPLNAFTNHVAAWVYIMTNRKFGTPYIGATTDLLRRVWEHKNEIVPSFTAEYHLHLLVYFEEHQDMYRALQRERTMKHWGRAWKVALIEQTNPEWDDLYPSIAGG